MGNFLNSIASYEEYKKIAKTRFFVDKSPLLEELISAVAVDGQQYFCITRPRRFGKTVMANMVAAFFGRVSDGKELFDQLKIADSEYYGEYLNQWDVIAIDFSRLPKDGKNYEQYIGRIQDGLNKDLLEAYPEQKLSMNNAVWDNL